MLKVVCGTQQTVGEEDPTLVIWKEVIAVGQFLTFMKNLWFWFFKKIRMVPVPVPQINGTPGLVLEKNNSVLILEIRPGLGSGSQIAD